jgi:hypothetical protein
MPFSTNADKARKPSISRFDRTPFTGRWPILENELRRETGYAGKIKLTVAQMIVSIYGFRAHEID